MAVNIKLIKRFELDPEKDTMGRSWAGWDENESNQVNWLHNRGRYRLGAAIDKERYATLSYDGAIRVVAELTGRTHTPVPEKSGIYWALEGLVLSPGHPVRDALVGTSAPPGRANIQYISDHAAAAEREAFLLTWNPDQWDWPEDELNEAIVATAAGRLVEASWATGSRKGGIQEGDRAFLLKQGAEPRGIVASGTFRAGGVFQAPHWRDPGRIANYADVDWDVVLDPDDPLSIGALTAIPNQDWKPQGSGTQIKPENVAAVESLWAQHVAKAAARSSPTPGSWVLRRRAARQGWIQDPILRKQVEDAAQDRLMKHYRALGWHVEDMRFGNSFDARATKGGQTLYLEAKGTLGRGESVIVSRRETEWAWDHPDQCVLGILSEIELDVNGDVDPSSGSFRLFEWWPDEEELSAREYDWSPADEKRM